MIQAIKRVFSVDPIKQLQGDSKAIVDIFTITINDLKEVNAKCEQERVKRQQEIQKLSGEVHALGNIQVGNATVIDKLNKLFKPNED